MKNLPNTRHGASHRTRGFTLVEVLATLTLLAIILPVAMEGISLSTKTAALAKQQMEAATLAATKLAELSATEAWQNRTLSGDFGQEWPQYRWSAEVQDWEGATVKQVDIHVTWTMRGTERSATLTTLIYTGE